MHFQKNKSISDVYFSGSFSHHTVNEKKGRKTSVNKIFIKDGKSWLVPAYYTCPKGIVVDVIFTTPIDEFNAFAEKWSLFDEEKINLLTPAQTEKAEKENPLQSSFSSVLIKNRKTVHCCHMQSTVYLPFNTDNKEATKLVRLYKLDNKDCHTFYRICFPCSTKRIPDTLTLQLNASKEHLTAAEFTIKPQETIKIIHPITCREYTLRAIDITEESIDFSKTADKNTRYPSDFSILKYTVSPEADTLSFRITDTESSDSPEILNAEDGRFLPDSSSAIAIIGGADGPTVMFAAVPDTKKYHTACSSLKFRRKSDIIWKFDFIEKIKEDKSIILKEKKNGKN